MDLISKLSRKDLVRRLPKLKYENNQIYKACQLGKQVRSLFKSKNAIASSRPLEILHTDLFGPSRTVSLRGKTYGLVILDDYTRFTWILFLSHKNNTLSVFSRLYKQISNEKNFTTVKIRSDHRIEFDNQDFEKFCTENGIDHNFSIPKTLRKNRVVERKNRTLIDITRIMLCEIGMPKYFWDEVETSHTPPHHPHI